jgi:hypothetical protein
VQRELADAGGESSSRRDNETRSPGRTATQNRGGFSARAPKTTREARALPGQGFPLESFRERRYHRGLWTLKLTRLLQNSRSRGRGRQYPRRVRSPIQ